MTRHSRRRIRTAVVACCWITSIAIAAGATWWAADATLRPAAVPENTTKQQTVEVQQGTLGRALSFPALARWETAPAGFSAAAGVVTSIDFSSESVITPGARLMSVDLRPVTAAQGDVPAFRDLAQGATGTDVTQLQHFLKATGFLTGEPTGTFGPSTTTAVRAWQKTLGVERTGIVLAADLLYLPQLPARALPAAELVVGAHVPPDTPLLQVLAQAPTITVPLDPAQLAQIDQNSAFTVVSSQHSWPAVIAETRAIESSTSLDATLTAPDGGPVCAADCATDIPMTAPDSATQLSAQVTVIPETTGPMVPQAALGTDPGGRAVVYLADGTVRRVTVRVAADGQAIIDGVDVGTRIVLIAPKGEA